MPAISLGVNAERSAAARPPLISSWAMCDTSNKPADWRVARCSADSSGILHRHIPARKWHHARAVGAMKRMKWCSFCVHAIPHGSQQKTIYHVRYMPPLSRNLRDLPSTNGLVAHWPSYSGAMPVAGFPRRWALPCPGLLT